MTNMPSIDHIIEQMQKERQAAASDANKERSNLVKELVEAGVYKLTIDFAGSGDSGSIEDISAMSKDDESLDLSKDLEEKIEEWCYTYLSGTGVDWYNNEGGQGEINFDLSTVPYKFTAYVDVNEVTSTTAFSTEEVA